MIDLTKVTEDRNELGYMESIHNPFPRMCGSNGRYSSGQDFMGSVLKVSHYIGTIESFLERGFGKGTIVNKQDISTWKKRNLNGAPYVNQLDTIIGSWFERFVILVGEDGVEELLLEPLRKRI